MVKVSLYSITYSGMYYVGRHVPLTEMIPKAKAMGFDGIEICGKRPFGFPPDLDADARRTIRELAASEDVEISAVASYNNFASPIMEEYENELLMVREQIRLAHDLGAPLVRVFTYWKGVTQLDADTQPPRSWITYDFARDKWHYTSTKLDEWRRVRNGLKECAAWAEEYDVRLALQNHIPVVQRGYEDTLQMIREIESDYVQMSLDVPLFTTAQQTSTYIREAVEACRDLIIHSHFGGNYRETADGTIVQIPHGGGVYSDATWTAVNYPAFIAELKRIGYDGHVGYEACSPIVIDHEPAGIAEVDRRTQLAVRYLKGLIAHA